MMRAGTSGQLEEIGSSLDEMQNTIRSQILYLISYHSLNSIKWFCFIHFTCEILIEGNYTHTILACVYLKYAVFSLYRCT
jgi:hypothetical protein